MRMNDKAAVCLKRAGKLQTLLLLMCFIILAVQIPREEAVFGMETEVSCTIFIYMCGSNLESQYGLASENIDELLGADIPDSTTVVIETGGTSRWWSSEWIAEDKLQRYIIRDHHLELLQEMENGSMGSGQVFGDFLTWGLENYTADRNILVLWDHGGSSADGVCYDENYGFDFLNRAELKGAFDQAHLPERFDLICLDTCYMASLANASLLSEYVRYMTASQTIVPGPGMDYKALAEGAAGSDIEDLGKVLCDTFLVKSGDTGRGDVAQLAFLDLDAAAALVKEVDQSVLTLKKVYEKTGDSFGFFAGANMSRVAGSGSKANVIDLMTFVNAMSILDLSNHRARIQKLLGDLVVYQVCGVYTDLNGVSIYYPLNYDEAQLADYERVSPAGNYSGLLHEIYADLPEVTITFKDSGSIGEDGTFDMEMNEESRAYLRGVTLRVWKESDTIQGMYTLLADHEVETHMTGIGRSLSALSVSIAPPDEAYALDSHPLLLSVSSLPRTQLYSAPVCVNGEDMNYSFMVAQSLFKRRQRIIYTMLGNLFDENGLPSRAVGHLESGDRIAVYSAVDETGDSLIPGEEFTIEDWDIRPEMIPLEEGNYRCQYIVTDITGKTIMSDYCTYEITKKDGVRQVQAKKILKDVQ